MPLVLYILLVAVLLGTGWRAVNGHGLRLTLFRTYYGQAARPIGIVLIALGVILAAWFILNPALPAYLWRGPARTSAAAAASAAVKSLTKS